LPASSDTGHIAKVIYALRSSVEKHLGRNIAGAVVAIPDLPALYQEDVQDAFEYAGLIYIPDYPYWYGRLYFESGAVYVGNGFGICSNYTDSVSCDDEKRSAVQKGRDNFLSVSYTEDMLSSTLAWGGLNFAYPKADMWVETDLALGWNKRPNNSVDYSYWEVVRKIIVRPVIKMNEFVTRNVSKVLVHGDCALDERFQVVLRDAVDDVIGNKTKIFMFDPVYSAARGAAEMAKQVYWTYNQTLGK
jgi:hypothetical protein